jgi:hypothetical protein
MAQVNPIAGVWLPYWIRANHGRTLEAVNPMRTSLQLASLGDFDTLKLVGGVTRKTNAVAVEGILQTGLRSDFDNKGRLTRGRSSIMCYIWGSVDQVRDTFLQRSSGNVRVVIDVGEWWNQLGSESFDKFNIGVKVFVIAGGAVLFDNIDPYIATVLPLTVVSKVMMNHQVSDDFIRRVQEVQDQDDAEYGRNRNTAKLRAGWFNIFSPELARAGMPPADSSAFIFSEHKTLECRYVNTMRDIKTPQMGTPDAEFPAWVYSSDAISHDEMYATFRQRRVKSKNWRMTRELELTRSSRDMRGVASMTLPRLICPAPSSFASRVIV